MASILIRLSENTDGGPSLVHRLRNYGEDVYRYVRDANPAVGEVSIEEVDAASSEFSVHGVTKPKIHRLCQWLEDEARRQNLSIELVVR